MEKYVFGVDLGGTTIKFGLLRSDLTLLEQWSIPTNTNDKGADLLKDITDELRKLARTLPPSSVLGVGVGVPGARLGRIQRGGSAGLHVRLALPDAQ